MPRLQINDLLEILIIAVLLYVFMVWIQSTRAYTLLRGILVVGIFTIFAWVFQLTTILWISQKIASVALIALVIIFQPELRKALDSLGQRNFLFHFFVFDNAQEIVRFSDAIITLIVIEQNIRLDEFINTGIEMDSLISSQLLVNIFEHNTPLHDGAVIMRGERLVAATCYLPLSENVSISKKYGTRHRAALGISEMSDSFTIIVSEETGRVSYAYMGELTTGVTPSELREQLHYVQQNSMKDRNENNRFRIWKVRDK